MRRALWACISLAAVIGGAYSCGWAVERELCGVRLGDRALRLLDREGYGQPAYIGPLGTISVAPLQQQRQAGATGTRTTGAAQRSGPSGPSAGAARGSRRGGGARGSRGRMASGLGVAPGGVSVAGHDATIVLTGAGAGMRGGRAGARGGATRGGARGTRGAIGGGGARRATTGVVQGAGMFWYYRRPGGAVIVLSLDLTGEVTALSLSGVAPTPGGNTSKGIGLGRSYMDIIGHYGYPDQTVSAGTTLELTYVDHGVRFTLDSMRLRQIEIGAAIIAETEAAPSVPTETAPPVGMSTEELRGYL